MAWLEPAIIASLLCTGVLAATTAYLAVVEREDYLGLWAWAWALYALRFAGQLARLHFPGYDAFWLGFSLLAGLWSGVLLLAGVARFHRRPLAPPVAVAGGLVTLWVPAALHFDFSFFALTLPVFLLLAYACITAGLFYLQNRELPRASRNATGWLFILWGIHKLDYPLLRPVAWFAPFGYLMGAGLTLAVALATLLTAFERTRRQVTEERERLILALEGGELAVWDTTATGDTATTARWTTTYSDRWYTMLGYAPQEMPADLATFLSLLHPDDRPRVEAAITAMTEGQVDGMDEVFRLRAKDGSYRWIRGQGKVIARDREGRPRRITGVHQDFTTIKAMEAALQRSEATYRSLTANLPDLVYRIDVAGDGHIHFFNEAARHITGYSAAELASGRFCPIENLILAEDRPAVLDALEAAIDSGPPFTLRYRLQDAEGRIHHVVDRGTPIKDDGGNLVCIDGVIHDVTEVVEAQQERENLQLQLRQAQKLEALGTLAGGIAHDFNNILAAIIGYTELSLHEAEVAPVVRANLEEVLRAGHRARNLVKQILAFSRQREMETITLAPAPIVKEVIKLLRATVPSSIAIDTDIDEETSPIKAEPTQIHQLLMNLATNAVQAVGDKGEIFFHLGDRTLREGDFPSRPDIPPGHYVCLQVRDSGCGMEPEVLERIFDPFFTTKPPGQGTGMGLAVVYGIVQRHGGYIVVYSRPGEGATFTVLLPAAAGPQPAASEVLATSGRLPGGNEHLVVVDDETAIATYLERFFTWLGYQVTRFTDPRQAEHYLLEERGAADLLVTDQTMPGCTGMELAARVHRSRPELPIVLCSGYAATIPAEEARAAGVKAIIAKPPQRNELAHTVRQVLDGARD